MCLKRKVRGGSSLVTRGFYGEGRRAMGIGLEVWLGCV